MKIKRVGPLRPSRIEATAFGQYRVGKIFATSVSNFWGDKLGSVIPEDWDEVAGRHVDLYRPYIVKYWYFAFNSFCMIISVPPGEEGSLFCCPSINACDRLDLPPLIPLPDLSAVGGKTFEIVRGFWILFAHGVFRLDTSRKTWGAIFHSYAPKVATSNPKWKYKSLSY